VTSKNKKRETTTITKTMFILQMDFGVWLVLLIDTKLLSLNTTDPEAIISFRQEYI
jgi:hypothetical protein